MSIDYYQDSKQLFTDPFPKIRNNLRAKMPCKKREKHVKQRQETLAAKAAKRKKI